MISTTKAIQHDRASTPAEFEPIVEPGDVQSILQAWYRERGRSIEATLLLDRACNLLDRINASGDLRKEHERDAGRILRVVSAFRKDGFLRDH